MLISKSVLCQISALFFLPLILSQKYNPDYKVTDDVDSDYTSGYYSDEPVKKDYSKYYTPEQSSPISVGNSEVKEDDSGFVKPLDFSGLFGPSSFGFGIASSPVKSAFSGSPDLTHPFGLDTAASNQNHSGFVSPNEFKSVFDVVSSASEVGFRSQDFLPSSTKSSEIKSDGFFSSNFNKYDEMPGPSYISHKVPSSEAYKHVKPESPVFNKDNFELRDDSKSYKKYKSNDEYSDRRPIDETYETKSGYKAPSYATDFESTKIPYVNVSPKNSNTYSSKTKYSNEPQGTNSYSVRPTLNTLSAKPSYYPQQDSLIQSKYQPSTLTPYKKYSFQPTQFYNDIGSTVLPFETKIASTAASYLSSPIRTDTELVQKKTCKKIEKQLTPDEISHGRFRRQAMTCYVCTDPKSGGNFEQCSYTSDPNQKEYFIGSAQKYNSNEAPSTFRYKRYTETTHRNEEESEIKSDDSYGYPKPKSQRYRSRPKEFEEDSSPYQSPDFKEFYEAEEDKYRFGPEYFSFDPEVGDREKSSSELHLEELKRSGENCKKVQKESMTCMICENPKTGGNYEQCSYTSEPKEQKYAYVKESKFDGNDPIEEKIVESTEEKPTVASKQNERIRSRQRVRKPSQTSNTKSEDLCEDVKKESMTCKVCKNLRTGAKSEQCSYRSVPNQKQYAYVNEQKFNSKDHPNVDRVNEGTEHRPIKASKRSRQTAPKEQYEIPSHFADETEQREKIGVKHGGLGLDPDLYGKPLTFDEKKEEASEDAAAYHANPTNYEDYFSKIFPEYAAIKREEGEYGEASEQKELPAEYFQAASKKDVEEVLAEFATKDRSNCKKVSKGKLTCYLCVDEKGMKNEECMYVTESQPKSSHMAYHQKKNFRSVSPHKPNKIQESESQVSSDTQSPALSNAPLTTAITSESPLTASTALPIRKRKGFFKKASSSTEASTKSTSSSIKTIPKSKTLKQFSTKIIPEAITNAPLTSTLTTTVNKKIPRIARRTTNIKPQNITDSVGASSGTHYVYKKPPSKDEEHIATAPSEQKKRKISKRKEKKTRPSKESDEPEFPTPKEFDVRGSEGAFSSELKPMYSKKLGVTLPAFMLLRSEHEASFDESVASGK